MTPEQLARVVDAGRNVAGSEMHAVLDAMHDELMAIEQDNAAEDLRKAAPPPRPRIARMAGNPLHIKDPTIVIEAGEKIIGGQRLRLSADGKQVFLADSVAPLLGIAVTDADPGWPVVVRELNEIEREAAKFAGIELKTPATDAGQPPEPGPFDRFIRGEFFNGPAHPDNDPDVSGGGVPYPLTGMPAYPEPRLGQALSMAMDDQEKAEHPTPDQQEALKRISEAVKAGGDVIVTDDKPNPDAPVHGLAETLFYQDNNPEETDKPVAAVQHTADGKNHRVVVWFGEDGAAADQFATWFNTNRVDPVDELLGNGGTPVAATRPQPVYDALARNHAFDSDPEMVQFCKCGHSRYHDVHVLAK